MICYSERWRQGWWAERLSIKLSLFFSFIWGNNNDNYNDNNNNNDTDTDEYGIRVKSLKNRKHFLT